MSTSKSLGTQSSSRSSFHPRYGENLRAMSKTVCFSFGANLTLLSCPSMCCVDEIIAEKVCITVYIVAISCNLAIH